MEDVIYGYLSADTLTNIANAIREKNGQSTAVYKPNEMPDAIRAISGGGDTSDATATQDEIVKGKTAYIATGKVTGTLEVVTYYTGTEIPSSEVGEINDLYIVTQ